MQTLMTARDSVGANSLRAHLIPYSENQFTGRLDLRSSTGETWNIYLHYGRIVWADGGSHPTRRWRRQVALHCPKIAANAIGLRQTDKYECWHYHVLTLLALRQKLSGEQIVAIIQGMTREILFDLLQSSELSANSGAEVTTKVEAQLSKRPSKQSILPPNCLVEMPKLLAQAERLWEAWIRANLTTSSPNQAPIIEKSDLLLKQTSKAAYKNLVTLVNGKRTLRDLAVFLKQDLLVVSKSLYPYIEQKAIALIEIPDLPRELIAKTVPPATTKPKPTTPKPLIACIDDSPQICQTVAEIVGAANYRFVGISEAVQALPMLLKHKPDLIFLDLVMPIANGYEICAQIRRVSAFEKIPVIILTSHDGVVDRVRAKMVGASDFLSKPIDATKLLATIRKHYLATKSNSRAV
ncbi:MAG: response regulator, partial [Oscillatoria sp. PMC 1076.18]|nr:response regulator [Oscillatoria sp. PMC 1076.18]